MKYQLSDVSFNDTDMLVRQCEFPAMRRDPLQMAMFPKADPDPEEEEEEIRWTIEGLQESLQESLEGDSYYFRKVTTVGSGCYVGFAVWTFESSSRETRYKVKSKERRESWNPASLDVTAWNQVSKHLREERQRVLYGHQNIWSESIAIPVLEELSSCLGLNTIAVAPEHQMQGVGSMLMQWGCDMADSRGWNSFVMASPDGIQLYSKFDFKVVGQVRTEHGTFTSMFRESRPLEV